MNVRCQWLLTVRVRNHIRAHVEQHFQVRLADFVDLAQRGVFHSSWPSSALHGTFDDKRTVISRWKVSLAFSIRRSPFSPALTRSRILFLATLHRRSNLLALSRSSCPFFSRAPLNHRSPRIFVTLPNWVTWLIIIVLSLAG